MRKLVLAILFVFLTSAVFALRVGDSAPAFTAGDSHGQQHSLTEYKGKYRRPRVDQPGVPIHQETLRQRQHAETPKVLDRQGSHLADGDFFSSRRARLRDCRPGE